MCYYELWVSCLRRCARQLFTRCARHTTMSDTQLNNNNKKNNTGRTVHYNINTLKYKLIFHNMPPQLENLKILKSPVLVWNQSVTPNLDVPRRELFISATKIRLRASVFKVARGARSRCSVLVYFIAHALPHQPTQHCSSPSSVLCHYPPPLHWRTARYPPITPVRAGITPPLHWVRTEPRPCLTTILGPCRHQNPAASKRFQSSAREAVDFFTHMRRCLCLCPLSSLPPHYTALPPHYTALPPHYTGCPGITYLLTYLLTYLRRCNGGVMPVRPV